MKLDERDLDDALRVWNHMRDMKYEKFERSVRRMIVTLMTVQSSLTVSDDAWEMVSTTLRKLEE